MYACSECRAEEKAMLFNIKRGNNEKGNQPLPEARFVLHSCYLDSYLRCAICSSDESFVDESSYTYFNIVVGGWRLLP